MSQNRIYTGDSATLTASLFGGDGITPIPTVSVTWDFMGPNGVQITGTNVPANPTVNQAVVLTASATVGGTPYPSWTVLRWDGALWNQVTPSAISFLDHNTASLTLPGSVTQLTGLYHGRAQFTLNDTTTHSQPASFEVIDPLQDKFNVEGEDLVLERAWMKFEDIWDSELGGPHLRDTTKASFSKDKMALLLPDALYTINNVYQPVTGFDPATFPYTAHGPLYSQGLVVQTIRHLMRSYVEQWTPQGANISWYDRRDYLQRWQSVLQLEDAQFMSWLDLFKKDQMSFGTTATLVGGYNNGAGRYPRYMRGRFPYVYRY